MDNAIRVDRRQLINTILKNRELHKKEYDEAIKGFRILAIQMMKENLKKAEDGENIDLYINLDRPESHTEEYDDALGLLEMGTDDSVAMNTKDYKRFVKDEWAWTHHFKSNHRVYYAATQTGFAS